MRDRTAAYLLSAFCLEATIWPKSKYFLPFNPISCFLKSCTGRQQNRTTIILLNSNYRQTFHDILHSLSAFPLSISVYLSSKLCSTLCGSKFCSALTIWQVFINLRPLQPWRCLQLTFFACRCLKVFLANIFQAAGQAGKCCKCKVTLEILPPLSSGSVML